MRIRYRLWQFWQALTANPSADEMALAEGILTPSLLQLFKSLPPIEQAHAIRVCKRLVRQGENNLSLLTAALLHDIGKSRYPLRLWERVVIVLGKRWMADNKVSDNGDMRDNPERIGILRRPFRVAARHAEWGAQILEEKNVDALTVWLVRHHQTPLQGNFDRLDEMLLEKLKQADRES